MRSSSPTDMPIMQEQQLSSFARACPSFLAREIFRLRQAGKTPTFIRRGSPHVFFDRFFPGPILRSPPPRRLRPRSILRHLA